VVICEKGVWNEPATLTMRRQPSDNSWENFVDPTAPPSGHDLLIPLTTLAHLMTDFHLERVDFIKMDIEGAEQRVLSGARGLLAKFHPRLAIAAYHHADDPEKIPALVRDGWPGYRLSCRHCKESGHARIMPDVLLFH